MTRRRRRLRHRVRHHVRRARRVVRQVRRTAHAAVNDWAPRYHARGAEWKGDRLATLGEAADAGWDRIDQNLTAFVTGSGEVGYVTYVVHWPDAWRNNFRFYLHPGGQTRARRMKRSEARRTAWTAEEVARWRRTADPHSERPRLYVEHAAEAVRVGIVLIGELKSHAHGLPDVGEQLVADARRVGHPARFMGLENLGHEHGDAAAKCAAIEAPGGEFLLIFGRTPLRAAYKARAAREVPHWSIKPTALG